MISFKDFLLSHYKQSEFFHLINLIEMIDNELFNQLRFTANPSLAFPETEIEKISYSPGQKITDLQINFIGLIGAHGVLPNHFNELVIQQLHHKENALKDFLDIFHHRIAMLFYQASKKYKICTSTSTKAHSIETILYSLTGNYITDFTEQIVSSERLFYYTKFFFQKTRSAVCLSLFLSDFFEKSIKIKQFVKNKILFTAKNGTCLSKQYAHLGLEAIVGKSTTDYQNKFRIVIESINYKEFKDFLPDGIPLKQLLELTRRYTGHVLKFDIQLILKKEEVPFLQLNKTVKPMLAWNTWLKVNEFVKDASDLILTAK